MSPPEAQVKTVKVLDSPKFNGFCIPGIKNEKIVPPGGNVDNLNPLLIVIYFVEVFITQVGDVGKLMNPEH